MRWAHGKSRTPRWRQSAARSTPGFRGVCERLEDRRLLAITVTNATDVSQAGLTTLREAILAAAPGEVINFDPSPRAQSGMRPAARMNRPIRKQ